MQVELTEKDLRDLVDILKEFTGTFPYLDKDCHESDLKLYKKIEDYYNRC